MCSKDMRKSNYFVTDTQWSNPPLQQPMERYGSTKSGQRITRQPETTKQ